MKIYFDLKVNLKKKFTIKNVVSKRPGGGISPMKIYKVLGKKAKKNLEPDEIIKI